MTIQRILVVIGTRPEAIKMAPLVKLLQKQPAFQVQVCLTGQHQALITPILQLFEITADFDLNLMKAGQSLNDLTADILKAMPPVFAEAKPDLLLVHGDTSTTLAAALSGYYQQIPIGHIEAGLRTGDLFSPFPEEANRRLTSVLAQYHFAPTAQAKTHLLHEGKPANRIWVTGNTVIDSLQGALQKLAENPPLAAQLAAQFPFLDPAKKLILVTGHRRENVGAGFQQICQALAVLARQHSTVQIVYPLHPNPSVNAPVTAQLSGIDNLFLLPPQDYLSFIYLLANAYLVLTDSGGIQEEAPALQKPVLILRQQTERQEALHSGAAKLVGTEPAAIVAAVSQLLNAPEAYAAMAQAQSPYGDGQACERIIQALHDINAGLAGEGETKNAA